MSRSAPFAERPLPSVDLDREEVLCVCQMAESVESLPESREEPAVNNTQDNEQEASVTLAVSKIEKYIRREYYRIRKDKRIHRSQAVQVTGF